ncbi:MAG: hypothetical protein Q4B71_07890 [Cardiobacteriaceae bacterium]|nr:hypothetical protein [Cardiobacteriaceae bacterium]
MQIYWQNIFDNEEQKSYWDQSIANNGRAMIDFFLYSFLQIKTHEPKYKHAISSVEKQQYTRVDKLFLSYKDFIQKQKIDISMLIKEMKEYSQIFYHSLEPNIDNINLPHNN